MSETLRLELAPLGVRVVAVVTGAVESNIMSCGNDFSLPDNSSYRPLSRAIEAAAQGNSIKSWMATETYAERVVCDVVDGANGKIWRGSMASAVRFILTKLPSFIVVCLTLLSKKHKVTNIMADKGQDTSRGNGFVYSCGDLELAGWFSTIVNSFLLRLLVPSRRLLSGPMPRGLLPSVLRLVDRVRENE